ncbi:MAG: phosphatase PAP2 family protein [Ignavibacteriales bacterium]|nr:phosphatase PAP2 family protein [Ignavibacteriales bacterium]
MFDALIDLDKELFLFLNQGTRNWLFDIVLPFLTDINRKPIGIVIHAILWLLLLTKGGRPGMIAALLLIPTIALSDQLNSSFLKFIVDRPRPCHELVNVHLLVGCGSGYSFPSSHAVNNFAAAMVLSYFLPRWTWAFFCYASVICFSRIYVGVHYPSDVIAGAMIGLVVGFVVVVAFRQTEEWWRRRNGSKTVTP